jgi:hypothetical protein
MPDDLTVLSDDALEQELRALERLKLTIDQRAAEIEAMAATFRGHLAENAARKEALESERHRRANPPPPVAEPEPIAPETVDEALTEHEPL